VTAYEWIIVICVILWTIMAIGALVAIFVVVGVIKRQVTGVTKKADAVLEEARRLAKSTAEAADHVASRATSIADKAEMVAEEARETVHTMAGQVTATTGVLRDAVSEPVVGIAAGLAGLKKGIEAWLKARKPKDAP